MTSDDPTWETLFDRAAAHEASVAAVRAAVEERRATRVAEDEDEDGEGEAG